MSVQMCKQKARGFTGTILIYLEFVSVDISAQKIAHALIQNCKGFYELN